MATKGTLKYRKVTRTPQSGPNKNKQMSVSYTHLQRYYIFPTPPKITLQSYVKFH